MRDTGLVDSLSCGCQTTDYPDNGCSRYGCVGRISEEAMQRRSYQNTGSGDIDRGPLQIRILPY